MKRNKQVELTYMSPVKSRAELKDPPPGYEQTIAVDETLSGDGNLFVWIHENGKWSDCAVLVGISS